MLDELEAQGFGQLGEAENWPGVRTAKNVGKWLEETTIGKEVDGAIDGNEEPSLGM